MAVLLWCMTCAGEVVITGDVPVVCPTCRAVTTWTTAPPYHVNENDARFLKSIHILQSN
jgi:Zn finger protein HypA/HybF involved in hydrogenase expression